jgi:Tol biopolymer transport system component
VQVTYGKYDNGSAIWTADGTQLLFAAKRQHYSIYQVDANGAAPEGLILDTGIDTWPIDLSPDGHFLLFVQGIIIGRAQSQLWVNPMDGKSSPFRLLAGDALESDGQFSPDGHWVAYASNQSGRNEVYLVAFHLPRDRIKEEFPQLTAKCRFHFPVAACQGGVTMAKSSSMSRATIL